MINNKVKKFENPIRIAELNPQKTLSDAGFNENMSLCDIGAGTGIFSFAAAQLSSGDIYALEISDDMLELLNQRINDINKHNIHVKKVNSEVLPIEDDCCDMAVMVTVLHEIENKEIMLDEIKRILNNSGRLLIVEFYKKETPMGPPASHRISEAYVEELCNSRGLSTLIKQSLGDNLYYIVFEK